MDADDGSGLDAGVDAYAGAARHVERTDGAGLRLPLVRRVLRIEAHLDRMPAGTIGLAAERLALGDPDLLGDEVDAEHLLGHRVLDLEAGVHLEEPDLAAVEVRVGDEELDRAGADVVDRLDRGARRVVQRRAYRDR